MTRLIDELNTMHAHYVEAINAAIDAGDVLGATELAEAYDDEAIRLMAEREGKTHLLPLRRPATADSALRRLVRRLTPAKVA